MGPTSKAYRRCNSESPITPSRGNEQSPSKPNAEQRIQQDCLAVVEEFRTGKTTLGEATLHIFELLPDSPNSSAAYLRYADQLAEVERDRASAAVQGEHLLHANTPFDIQADASKHEDGNSSSGEPEPSAHSLSTKQSYNDAFTATSETSHKKLPNASLFAWHSLLRSSDSLDPVLAQTLKLKRNYLRDPKAAKNDLLGQVDCPDFPEALWTDVLLGRFIDLDKVYAGHYTLGSKHAQMHSLGDIDIVLNTGGSVGKASKSVRTHGEWSIAFNSAKAAILFAYPHCSNELAIYEHFIIGQFAAFTDALQHYRVINLDKAMRVQVARTNKYSLKHFNRFNDLLTHHIFTQQSSSSQAGKKRGKPVCDWDIDVEICKRYNAGHCTGDLCKYRHVCLKCGEKHQAKTCKKTHRGDGSN